MRLIKNFVWRVLPTTLTLAAIVGGAIAAFSWWPAPKSADSADQETWTCSMHPQIRQSSPGQCPLCGMNLIPVSQLTAEKDRLASIGVETEPVTYRELRRPSE